LNGEQAHRSRPTLPDRLFSEVYGPDLRRQIF
jgi:hypothetical protein